MDAELTDTVIHAPGSRTGRTGAAEPSDAIDEDTVVRPAAHVQSAAAAAPAGGDGPGHAARTDTVLPVATRATVLNRFRVNGGDAVPTDVVTLIGRAPRGPRVPGASVPRLVAVPSPAHEVSATHLEVRQQGSSVVVTDLRSTNGTVVSAPGSDRLALRPGESFVAGPGSIIDIGDGNVVEVLPVDRFASSVYGRYSR